jgi:hypothetical protein
MSQEERSVFWEVTVSAILNRKVCMYMCPIPNNFRDRAISLYNSKIVSNAGIYCSSGKVGTVYILENSVNICSSVQFTVYCIVK